MLGDEQILKEVYSGSIIMHLFIFMKHGEIFSGNLSVFIEGIGLIEEEWKLINGSSTHEISSFGRVKSLKRKNKLQTRLMKPQKRNEYLSVHLLIHGIDKNRTIHSLVAEHFIPNPENKPEVNHIGKDENGKITKFDNRYFSLEWATQSENMKHAHKNGLVDQSKGEDHYKSYLTKEQVLEIVNSSKSDSELSEIYGMPRRCINTIRLGRSWSHVTGIIYKKKELKRPTKEQILEIFNSTEHIPFFKDKYGFCATTINGIRTGRYYSDVTGKVFVKKWGRKKN